MIINTADALQRLGGNAQLLDMLLNKFIQQYQDSDQQLENFLDAKAFQEAAQLIHSVKGAAANLGMENLAHSAKLVEDEIKQHSAVSETLLLQYQQDLADIDQQVNQS